MGKVKIMVVEDEWIIANDIKNSLVDQGFMVTSIAASGEDAILRAEEDLPDLVLMDIMLQGEMNGIETAREIRGRFGIPIIYLTAYENKYLVEQAKQTDHYGYLLKPFKDRELQIAIEMALHRDQLDKERARG
ncbi:MAG: response regulator [Proteobacteria bacterium]|nr:response regulator [Pseudomonadota bacterium]MBU1688891.1 response regulator [Pseudomonadota bacterium]